MSGGNLVIFSVVGDGKLEHWWCVGQGCLIPTPTQPVMRTNPHRPTTYNINQPNPNHKPLTSIITNIMASVSWNKRDVPLCGARATSAVFNSHGPVQFSLRRPTHSLPKLATTSRLSVILSLSCIQKGCISYDVWQLLTMILSKY